MGIDNENPVPSKFAILNNYPNPFNPTTTIRFNVGVGDAKMHPLTLTVLDINGRVVETLVNEKLEIGQHEFLWNGTNYSSGVYFIKIQSGDIVKTRKMILLK